MASTALIGGLALAATPLASAPAGATPPAAFTTTDIGYGTGPCLNGNNQYGTVDVVNCNLYQAKEDVWLNGGPLQQVAAGTYFFAVLAPGGQADPNDGSAKNLSSPVDSPYTNREFSVDSSGTVTYPVGSFTASHNFDSAENKIQLAPYSNTPNNGGVYILAICALNSDGSGYPVDPSTCKYDAFKVTASDCTPNCGVDPGAAPTLTKTADGAYTDTFTWGITKAVDQTKITTGASTATFNYTVNVTHDGGTISGVTVSGLIDVNNPNWYNSFQNTDPVTLDSVTDVLSDGTGCTVDTTGTQTVTVGGSPVQASGLTLDNFDNYFPYSCSLGALPQGELDNTATASWSDQHLTNLNEDLSGGLADFTFSNVAFTGTNVHQTITPTDTFGLSGSSGSTKNLCVLDSTQPCTLDATTTASPTKYQYGRTVSVTRDQCVAYTNTAVTYTNGPFDSKTVTVCGPVAGGLTMGFWQNKNGQGIVTGGTKSGTVCNSGTYLRTYKPFADLSSTASCSQVATYVTNVIKAANAGGSTMNPMLKAQMLATALDAYFSTPGNDKIAGFNGGNTVSLGTVTVDLTKVCNMLDGSGGSASCSGSYTNTGAAFGAPACQSVNALLTNAAMASNAGGSVWYGQVKATQGLAKNTFDAINNQVALTC